MKLTVEAMIEFENILREYGTYTRDEAETLAYDLLRTVEAVFKPIPVSQVANLAMYKRGNLL